MYPQKITKPQKDNNALNIFILPMPFGQVKIYNFTA